MSAKHTQSEQSQYQKMVDHTHNTNRTPFFAVKVYNPKTLSSTLSIDWCAVFVVSTIFVIVGYFIGSIIHLW